MPNKVQIFFSIAYGWAAVTAFYEHHYIFGAMLLLVSYSAFMAQDS